MKDSFGGGADKGRTSTMPRSSSSLSADKKPPARVTYISTLSITHKVRHCITSYSHSITCRDTTSSQYYYVVIIKTDSAERYYNENRHFTVHTAIPTNAATLSIHSKLITCFTALKHLQIGLCMPTSLTIHQHGSHLDIQYGATHVNITAHWRKDCLSVSVVNHVL